MMSWLRIWAAVFVALHSALLCYTALSPAQQKLHEFLTQNAEEGAELDHEKLDYFETLSAEEREEEWIFQDIEASDDETEFIRQDWDWEQAADKIFVLEKYDEPVNVEVLLVGFEGVPIQELQLLKYLNALSVDEFANVIEREKEHPYANQHASKTHSHASDRPNVDITGRRRDAPYLSHRFSVKRDFVFHAAKAPHALAAGLEHIIKEACSGPGCTVPYASVDDYIERLYTKSPQNNTYTIYILNLTPAGGRYSYTYVADDHVCPTSVGVGKHPSSRYIWLDMAVGPLHYGPRVSGEGLVTDTLLPYAPNYVDASAGQSKPSFKIHNLLVDIATFTKYACQHVIRPDIYRRPYIWTDLTVQLVTIHDHKVGEMEKYDKFDWEAIQKQLSAIPLLKGQTLSFKKTEVSLLDDPIVSQIRSNALKTHSSPTHSSLSSPSPSDASATEPATLVQTTSYLDSKELHYWFQHYRQRLLKEETFADDRSEDPTYKPPRHGVPVRVVVPVFLFDISYRHLLLMDRVNQAVSFRDMVVAIQTESAAVESPLQCSGQTVMLDPEDATRPVLAALLQTIWGVAPTHQVWSPTHLAVQRSYLFSAAATPFGPLAPSSSYMSFSQHDAAARHLIYMDMTESLRALGRVLGHFLEYSWGIDTVLDYEGQTEFISRWHMLEFKKRQALQHLSHHQYNNSFVYVQSMKYDASALEEILQDAHAHVHTYLSCERKELALTEIIAVLVTMALVVFVLRYAFVNYFANRPRIVGSTARRQKIHTS